MTKQEITAIQTLVEQAQTDKAGFWSQYTVKASAVGLQTTAHPGACYTRSTFLSARTGATMRRLEEFIDGDRFTVAPGGLVFESPWPMSGGGESGRRPASQGRRASPRRCNALTSGAES